MKFLETMSINCGSRVLKLEVPVVMGILNVTPDSFYDGSEELNDSLIVSKVEKMIIQGAAIIDIGAVSTRPGSSLPNADTEIERLLPKLMLIRKLFPDIIISVDTYRKQVAEVAIAEGADIINDISGGTMDVEMIAFMCRSEAAYVLMHIQGTPETMQVNPQYDNVKIEVEDFFKSKLSIFNAAGKENIILDPGFGFGKNVEHNYKLLQALKEYTSLRFPLLAGVSRKSMINKVLNTKPDNALNGTTVVNTIALLNGANILRVHDVKPAIEAIRIVQEYNKA